MVCPFLSPAMLVFGIAGLEGAKDLAGELSSASFKIRFEALLLFPVHSLWLSLLSVSVPSRAKPGSNKDGSLNFLTQKKLRSLPFPKISNYHGG